MRVRADGTAATVAVGTSASWHQPVVPTVWLSSLAVAKRKQTERKKQQRQEKDVAAAYHEHDHGDCKANGNHAH